MVSWITPIFNAVESLYSKTFSFNGTEEQFFDEGGIHKLYEEIKEKVRLLNDAIAVIEAEKNFVTGD